MPPEAGFQEEHGRSEMWQDEPRAPTLHLSLERWDGGAAAVQLGSEGNWVVG